MRFTSPAQRKAVMASLRGFGELVKSPRTRKWAGISILGVAAAQPTGPTVYNPDRRETSYPIVARYALGMVGAGMASRYFRRLTPTMTKQVNKEAASLRLLKNMQMSVSAKNAPEVARRAEAAEFIRVPAAEAARRFTHYAHRGLNFAQAYGIPAAGGVHLYRRHKDKKNG